MKRVRSEDVMLETPVQPGHLSQAGAWFMTMYPEVEATPEKIGQAQTYFEQSFLDRPDSAFWGVTVEGVPVGILGLLERNPITETAIIFGIGDRQLIEREYAGLGRMMVQWMTSAMVPGRFKLLRAYCRETVISNMMTKAGFEEIDLNDRAMVFRG